MDWAGTGTFATRYSGTRQAITQNYTGAFHLADSTRGAIIHTWNLNGSINVQNRIELSDNDNNWTAAEHSATENDMGLDVHWALQQIYDRLNTVHGINSFNDNGFAIDAHIRYGTTDNQRDNAFWDPTLNVLVFGDGNVKFRPVACIDAVAHEFGHGITDFQIGWGSTGDPRAFHEGLSDIWGAIMESRIRPNSTWQIGEQIDLSYGCLRNIQSTNDPNARDKIANTFGSTQYNSDDPYVRSGVFSHWFYLLVNGGTGTNDLGRSYSVRGIGMDYAESLIVQAVFDGYLRFTTSYAQIRTSMINAAREIAGANSFLEQQIENAWYAVGVGSTMYQYIISGPSQMCTQATYTIDNLPEGATVQWNTSANITSTSYTETSLTASTNMLTGTGVIFATINIGQFSLVLTPKYVTFDGCYPAIEGPDETYLSMVKEYFTIDESVQVVSWMANGVTLYPANSHRLILILNQYGPGLVSLILNGILSNGDAFTAYKTVNIIDDYENLILSPNPVDATYTTVSLTDVSSTDALRLSKLASEKYQIQLWNSSGLIRQVTTDQKKYQLDLSGLSPGFYYVHVIKDGLTYRRQLVVQ